MSADSVERVIVSMALCCLDHLVFCLNAMSSIFHTEQGLWILSPNSSADHLRIPPLLTGYNIRYCQRMLSWNILQPTFGFHLLVYEITVQSKIADPLKHTGARWWKSVWQKLVPADRHVEH